MKTPRLPSPFSKLLCVACGINSPSLTRSLSVTTRTETGLSTARHCRRYGVACRLRNSPQPGAVAGKPASFIDEVVPHELAHLLVWKEFGRVAPHGKEWKWMMESVLGVPARRTHQFELESVRRNTFPYRCKCQQHQLTLRRHNRVVRGEAIYRCVRCGEPLMAEAAN